MKLSCSIPLTPGSVLTLTEPLELLLGAAPIALANRRIICVDGQPGCGKTVALDVLANNLTRPVVTLSLNGNLSDKQVIEHVYRAIQGGCTSRLTRDNMMSALRQRLAGSELVLMVDEAQKASVKALELLRQLHDDPRTKCGLILSGANMQRLLAKEEMLESRVGLRVRFPRLDGNQLIPTVTAAYPVLASLEEWVLRETDRLYCQGRMRAWAEIYEWVRSKTNNGARVATRRDLEFALRLLTSEEMVLRP